MSDAQITPDQVINYLKNQPDFFVSQPDLLASLTIPHPQESGSISLVERQLQLLREHNKSLQHKLLELVDVARDNEKLSSNMYKLCASLLEAHNFSDTLVAVQESIQQLFNTDFVQIRFLNNVSDDPELAFDTAVYQQHFAAFVSAGKPVCGRITQEQRQYLYKDQADLVESSAMVPLSNGHDLGVLALGSRDADRFNPGMGHLFLMHLSHLVSSAVVVYSYDQHQQFA